jgi:hypothetical protein
MPVKKACSKCGEVKPSSDFSKDSRAKSGLQSRCRECEKEDRHASRDAIAERKKRYREKNLDDLRKKERERSRRLRQEDPEAVNEKIRNWKRANRDKVLEGQRKYREKNKEKIRKSSKVYNKKNKGRQIAYTTAYRAKRVKHDLEFRIRLGVRSRLRVAVKSDGRCSSGTKGLGCTISHLKEHLSSQFRDGMSWDNWGDAWEIDHIFPLSKANLLDPVEFFAVCNWRNMQPLTLDENAAKGNIVDERSSSLFESLKEMFVCEQLHCG